MKHILPPVVVAVVLIAGGAVWQGVMTERWGMWRTERLKEFETRLVKERIPLEIGPWQGVEDDVDPEQMKASNSTAHVARIYTNHETGEIIRTLIVCGKARHVALHTPDWCYRGAGYTMQGEHVIFPVDCGPEFSTAPQFRTAMFFKEDDTKGKQNLRILWAFSEEKGQWEGKPWPRVSYANGPALYKIYIVAHSRNKFDTPDNNPTKGFAELFMPLLDEKLFPKEPSAAESDGRSVALES